MRVCLQFQHKWTVLPPKYVPVLWMNKWSQGVHGYSIRSPLPGKFRQFLRRDLIVAVQLPRTDRETAEKHSIFWYWIIDARKKSTRLNGDPPEWAVFSPYSHPAWGHLQNGHKTAHGQELTICRLYGNCAAAERFLRKSNIHARQQNTRQTLIATVQPSGFSVTEKSRWQKKAWSLESVRKKS